MKFDPLAIRPEARLNHFAAKQSSNRRSAARKSSPRNSSLAKLVAGLFVISFASAGFNSALQGAEEKDWEKILKRGNTELAQGNTEKAISFFQGKCLKYPLSGACHTGLGKSLKRLGKIAEAKEELKKATELDPSYAPGFYELGSILEGDKEWAAAAQAFEKYLELSPEAGQRQAISDRIRNCKEHI
jgi:tetratricopeptide (TPR) repeat protein